MCYIPRPVPLFSGGFPGIGLLLVFAMEVASFSFLIFAAIFAASVAIFAVGESEPTALDLGRVVEMSVVCSDAIVFTFVFEVGV